MKRARKKPSEKDRGESERESPTKIRFERFEIEKGEKKHEKEHEKRQEKNRGNPGFPG